MASETKRATGTPMYMAIGQCGSVLGSHLFPNTDKPRYMSVRAMLRISHVRTIPDDPLPDPMQPWLLCLVRAILLRSSLRHHLDRTSFSPSSDSNSRVDIDICLHSSQIHYRYENARRDRVYGKREPGAKVDTQEFADRVSFLHPSLLSTPIPSPFAPGANAHFALAQAPDFRYIP